MTDLPAGDIWPTLVADPGIGISVLNAQLDLLYANRTVTRMYLDAEPEAVVGRNIADLISPLMVEECRRMFAQMAEDPGPRYFRDLWRGRQILVTARPVPHAGDQPDHVLSVCRYGADDADVDVRRIPGEVVDLGPLDILSPRELEVLALIGQGLIGKEIARCLECSPRTVDAHRRAIGRKLGLVDRVALARVAMEAGLRVDDARRERA